MSAPEWQRAFLASLEANASEPASRFQHLATVDERGLPSVRTVTWRGFDEQGRLRIATDRRSGKVRPSVRVGLPEERTPELSVSAKQSRAAWARLIRKVYSADLQGGSRRQPAKARWSAPAVTAR